MHDILIMSVPTQQYSLCLTGPKIGNIVDILPSRSVGLLLKTKPNYRLFYQFHIFHSPKHSKKCNLTLGVIRMIFIKHQQLNTKPNFTPY